jgi:catechol 2,3-dioxygenase
MAVMRLGYAHVRVTDLAEAKDHYANTMGLYETLSEGNKVYYKAWDEWDHHSVVLEEGGVGLVKYGWKVQYSSDIDEIEKKAQTFGVTVERMSKGENPEIGDGIRFTTPSDHVFEVYHEATLIGTEVGTHNPDSFPRHLVGVGVPALDHSLITAEDPGMMDRFLTDVFGFYATERVQTSLDDDADIIATWMTNSTQIHQLAVLAGPAGQAAPLRLPPRRLDRGRPRRGPVLHGRRADRRRPDPSRHHPWPDRLLLRPLGQPQRGVRRRLPGLPGPPDERLDP